MEPVLGVINKFSVLLMGSGGGWQWNQVGFIGKKEMGLGRGGERRMREIPVP